MDVVKEEKFENEGLVKWYDRQGRIVEIAFLQSGNGCTIQYIEDPARPDALPDERIVRWKSGEVFRNRETINRVKNRDKCPEIFNFCNRDMWYRLPYFWELYTMFRQS